MNISIAIIIVNWNGREDTLANLSSLSHLEKKEYDVTTLVVDNASTDGSISAIRKQFPEVTILENDNNLGFTGANNSGIAYAREKGAKYIWILNNDTIVDRYALKALITGYTRPGIYGSKIYFSPGREYHASRYTESQRGNVIWYAGGIIDWDNMYAYHRGVDEVDLGQYDTQEETDFVSGCSLFTSGEVLEKTGVFDDKYFAYIEDVDLCMRAKHGGFGTYFNATSKVWHKNAGSTNGPGNKTHEYYMTRNRLLFGFRYAPVRTRLALMRESVTFLFGNNRMRRQGVKDALLGRYGKGTL